MLIVKEGRGHVFHSCKWVVSRVVYLPLTHGVPLFGPGWSRLCERLARVVSGVFSSLGGQFKALEQADGAMHMPESTCCSPSTGVVVPIAQGARKGVDCDDKVATREQKPPSAAHLAASF